jgi:hypothetical protein
MLVVIENFNNHNLFTNIKNLFIMKKVLLSLLVLCAFVATTFGQNDRITFHNGKIVEGKVVKLEEFTIIFKYAGEDAEQTISKLVVGQILYSSGRQEQVTEKIVINGIDDWEKVEILLDKSQIVGLTKVDEVQGKTTAFFAGYTSASGTDKRSMKKLLEAAAALGCPFVYITADKDTKGGAQSGAYGAQGNKKGIAYKY